MAMKAETNRRRSDPTPLVPEQQGGWEFPLSRDEKKHRIMCLYQAELAEANRSSTEDRKALKALRKRHSNAGIDTRTDTVGTEGITHANGTNAAKGAACRSAPRPRLELYGVCLVALLGVLIAIWSCRSQAMLPCPCSVSGHDANVSRTLSVNMSETVPPNISDRILGIRSEGHVRLKLSNCMEAEWWFSTALNLLALDGNVSDADAYRNHIQGERGFALVCSQRFQEGAKTLEQHLLGLGDQMHAVPHLLNALGYAYFHIQDFAKAADLFQLSVEADKENPVPWSNLAAAMMVAGHYQQADDALNNAQDSVAKINAHQDHHLELIRSNVQVLYSLANNETLPAGYSFLPLVELWNGYLE